MKYQLPEADHTFTKFIGVGHVLCTVGYCWDDDQERVDDVRGTDEGVDISKYMSDSDWDDLELECYAHQRGEAISAAYEHKLDRGEQQAFDRMFIDGLPNITKLAMRKSA